MPDYQKMYYILCAGVSDVIDDMPDCGLFRPYRQRLESLLLEAEEVYIQTDNLLTFPVRQAENRPPGQKE